MKRTTCILAMVLALGACDRLGLGKIGFAQRGQTFDGQYFRGSAKSSERGSRLHFVATARPVSKSFEGAVASAEHQAIKHCLKYYGTSNIDWDVGPDTPREALGIDKDTVTLMGSCIDR